MLFLPKKPQWMTLALQKLQEINAGFFSIWKSSNGAITPEPVGLVTQICCRSKLFPRWRRGWLFSRCPHHGGRPCSIIRCDSSTGESTAHIAGLDQICVGVAGVALGLWNDLVDPILPRDTPTSWSARWIHQCGPEVSRHVATNLEFDVDIFECFLSQLEIDLFALCRVQSFRKWYIPLSKSVLDGCTSPSGSIVRSHRLKEILHVISGCNFPTWQWILKLVVSFGSSNWYFQTPMKRFKKIQRPGSGWF